VKVSGGAITAAVLAAMLVVCLRIHSGAEVRALMRRCPARETNRRHHGLHHQRRSTNFSNSVCARFHSAAAL
jgi:sterol desaturase/sphingolipid hydroxylase (fatty acid hydroxylase superfamily)